MLLTNHNIVWFKGYHTVLSVVSFVSGGPYINGGIIGLSCEGIGGLPNVSEECCCP